MLAGAYPYFMVSPFKCEGKNNCLDLILNPRVYDGMILTWKFCNNYLKKIYRKYFGFAVSRPFYMFMPLEVLFSTYCRIMLLNLINPLTVLLSIYSYLIILITKKMLHLISFVTF